MDNLFIFNANCLQLCFLALKAFYDYFSCFKVPVFEVCCANSTGNLNAGSKKSVLCKYKTRDYSITRKFNL